MHSIRHLRYGLIATILLCLVSGVAGGQGANTLLPSADIRVADNGELMGWQVNTLGNSLSELIEPGEGLLLLKLFVADEDISDQITWRRLIAGPGYLAQFVGTHTNLALEIRRNYHSGDNHNTIVHQVQVVRETGVYRNDIRVQLEIPPNLRKHAPNDGSLGDLFYGYNRTFAAALDASGVFEVVDRQLQASAVALVVRHVAVVITSDPVGNQILTVQPESGAMLTLDLGQYPSHNRQVLEAVELEGAALGGGTYRSFLYAEMWAPLRGLARLIERALQGLTTVIGNSGVAIILFALLLRIVMLPLGLWSIRQQRQFTLIQKQMKPKIRQISKTLKGAAKSEEILNTYKEYGISPFTGLKGSIGLFVQLPILIALFAVTTESALFRDVPFLWAPDLSLPDRYMALSFSIPAVGGYVNLLPILLGIISVFAALIQTRATGFGAGSSPRSGLLLALAFVFFFYSCAAALVLYWIVINVSQIFESQYVTRVTSNLAQN